LRDRSERHCEAEELKAAQPKIKNRTIEIVPGDFNKSVAGLLGPSGIADKTATFCLLDQRTFECEWQTLVTVSRHRADYKIELFYFLASGWLDRSMSGIKDGSILEKWWDAPTSISLGACPVTIACCSFAIE
jgi:three-Cys-motif partner protein